MKELFSTTATIVGFIVAIITIGIWINKAYYEVRPPKRLPQRHRWKRLGVVRFHKACETLYKLVKSNYVPDIIIACSRGGAIVAGIVSKHFQIPMAYVDYSTELIKGEKVYTRLNNIGIDISNKKVLVVDDAPHSGKMLHQAISDLKKLNPSKVMTAVIISQSNFNQSNAIKQRATFYSPDFNVFYTTRNDYKMPYEE